MCMEEQRRPWHWTDQGWLLLKLLRLLAIVKYVFFRYYGCAFTKDGIFLKVADSPGFYLFLQDCQFTKTKDDTALRVVYQGNLYLGGCNNCCKRWFITFNGAECSGPLPIDAVLWIPNTGENNHRPGFIEGYCNNIHKGKIRVGINIGNCAGYGNSNGYTGWNSVSRLIIEEVPRSQ